MTEALQLPDHAAQLTAAPKSNRFLRRVMIPWLFILPILLVHGFVVIIPSIMGMYYSLTDWSGMGEPVFIGLENYRRLLFDDPAFMKALGNNVIWLLFFLTVPFALSLLAAFLLSQIKTGGYIYRVLIFIPYILPSVVTASIWRNLLNPRMGIGASLTAWGIPGFDVAFLGDTSTSLLSIAFIDNWHYWGFLTVLFLTAMQSIPTVLYEAAKIDGANRWQQFINVTLPGIRPTVLFMLMMTAIWSFLVFEYIWILTEGGPAGSSSVMATVVYKNAFRSFEAGYAAAQGLIMSGFAGLIVMIFIILRRLGWEV
jgi:raffinose/stachyose/melibiose transport system permease protein